MLGKDRLDAGQNGEHRQPGCAWPPSSLPTRAMWSSNFGRHCPVFHVWHELHVAWTAPDPMHEPFAAPPLTAADADRAAHTISSSPPARRAAARQAENAAEMIIVTLNPDTASCSRSNPTAKRAAHIVGFGANRLYMCGRRVTPGKGHGIR